MVAWCAVYGCHNRNNCSYSFFELPKDTSLDKEWKIKVHREGKVPKDEHYYVCQIHFEKTCFERDMMAEIMGYTPKKKRLKPGSVPTSFEYKKKPKKRLYSEERCTKTRQKAFVSQATCSTYTETPKNM